MAGAVMAAPATPAQVALNKLQQEAESAQILIDLQAAAPRGPLAITNVKLIDPIDETVTPGQTVYVRGARITWVGDTAKAPNLASRKIIDGKGLYLAPGLTDMHVHSSYAGGWLLNLAYGVTTIRDMGGYPWILRARDHINAGLMLGPSDNVAGTIINSLPMEGYAVTPANSLDARRIVRQQAACGYDFIKVHNILSEAMLDAVADQAAASGMDLVGHIPHGVSIDHALHRDRMRVVEHLKGFLDDQTLLPGDEDYAKALAGAEVWITPTLYTLLSWDRGPWGVSVLSGPQARFTTERQRTYWKGLLDKPDANDLVMGQRFRDTQKVVMGRLIPLKPHWLAGTDAAGYPFNIMGFALLEELRLLQEHGLKPLEVLRAATTEPAAAMRQASEFGRIAVGMRADFVLLEANPLKDTAAYRINQGVMAHGIWLVRAGLDKALDRLAKAYAVPDSSVEASPVLAADIKSRLEAQMNTGFVFDAGLLKEAGADLEAAGLKGEGQAIASLAYSPKDGPCAQLTPLN
ncbi:MAG: amidohydrolase family protein [Caulobacteraceae bacterium]